MTRGRSPQGRNLPDNKPTPISEALDQSNPGIFTAEQIGLNTVTDMPPDWLPRALAQSEQKCPACPNKLHFLLPSKSNPSIWICPDCYDKERGVTTNDSITPEPSNPAEPQPEIKPHTEGGFIKPLENDPLEVTDKAIVSIKPTRVINIKDGRHPYDIYIGRANRSHHLAASKWANPYHIGKDGTRREVLDKYRTYILSRPDLLNALSELQGKTLACWCKPDDCHGDILIELLETTRQTALEARSAISAPTPPPSATINPIVVNLTRLIAVKALPAPAPQQKPPKVESEKFEAVLRVIGTPIEIISDPAIVYCTDYDVQSSTTEHITRTGEVIEETIDLTKKREHRQAVVRIMQERQDSTPNPPEPPQNNVVVFGDALAWKQAKSAATALVALYQGRYSWETGEIIPERKAIAA